MERGEQPRAAFTWVGIWVATKIELVSYPSDFVRGSIPTFGKPYDLLQPRLRVSIAGPLSPGAREAALTSTKR